MTPKEWTDRTSARFVEAWQRARHLERRLHPHDRAPPLQGGPGVPAADLRQRVHRAGRPYSGLYCVSCEDYYTEDQLIDGKCPVHGRPVVEMQEDNYFFKLSAFEQRLLDYYDEHPDFVRPVSKRNEALGFIRGGLRDVSITRTSFSWGVPVPWDSGHVFYVWYDALINYLTVAGYGGDDGDLRGALGRGAPPDRQGHPEVPLRVVAGHVHGGGHRPAAGDLRARLPTDGRAEAGQDDDRGGNGRFGRGRQGARTSPTFRRSPWPRTSASTRCATTSCATCRSGGDGDFSYEGIVARYNADLANNLGNLVSRVTTVVHSKCAGIGPGLQRVERRWPPWQRRCSTRRRPRGRAGRRTRRWRRRGG